MIGLDDPVDDQTIKEESHPPRKKLSVREKIVGGWQDYVQSFASEDDSESDKKKENKPQLDKARETAHQNIDYLRGLVREKVRGTMFEDNLTFLADNAKRNIKTVEEEIGQENIKEALKKTKELYQETKSDQPVLETVQTNIRELASLAKTSAARVEQMDKDDFQTAKTDVEEWIADKLVVGRITLSAFTEGYHEAKAEALKGGVQK